MRAARGAALLMLLGLLKPLGAQDKPDALAMYNDGRFREAAEVCLQELKEMPYNGDSFSVLGWALLKLAEYQEALDYALLGLSRLPSDARITEIAGEASYGLGKIEDALRYFEEYANLAPQGGRIERVYALMGECFIQLKEYNHADIALSTALHLNENDATLWARLGYVREMAKDYQWSLEAYSNALRLNPNSTDAQRGRSRVEAVLRGE